MANIDELYSEACACIEQGLCFDEIDDWDNAMIFYERSLNLITEAEKVKNHEKSKLHTMIIEGRKRVEERLNDLKNAKNQIEGNSDIIRTPKMVKEELKKQIAPSQTIEADLIFYIPDGVQLFIIEHGTTTAPTYPTSLEIFRFDTTIDKLNSVNAEAFIRVGPWTYPLLTEKTPVLRNDIGAYLVPNPTVESPDMYVGILLPKDLSETNIEQFNCILKKYAELHTHQLKESMSKEEREHLSHKLGDLLVKGGDFIAENIGKVAEKSSVIVTDHSTRIRSSMSPGDQAVTINPAIRYGVHYVHKGSKVVAKCTRYLLDRIGDMGVAVGRKIASNARKHVGDDEGGLVEGTIYVLGSGITSASTVWMALENASKLMAKNIADETVKTVEHKWGEQASTTTHETLYATGHTSLAALQLWDLGPRSVAGRAARKAGMQLVTDLRKNNSSNLDKKT